MERLFFSVIKTEHFPSHNLLQRMYSQSRNPNFHLDSSIVPSRTTEFLNLILLQSV